jgi:hypothetical protein
MAIVTLAEGARRAALPVHVEYREASTIWRADLDEDVPTAAGWRIWMDTPSGNVSRGMFARDLAAAHATYQAMLAWADDDRNERAEP